MAGKSLPDALVAGLTGPDRRVFAAPGEDGPCRNNRTNMSGTPNREPDNHESRRWPGQEGDVAHLGTCRPGDSCGLSAVTDNGDLDLHVRLRMSQSLLHGAICIAVTIAAWWRRRSQSSAPAAACHCRRPTSRRIPT